MDENEVSSRLHLVRALQMRTLVPSPPQPTPAPRARAAATAASTPKAGGVSMGNGGQAGSKKLCAECRQPLSGLPQRCGGCKVTYYCSKDCQKRAWPAHKDTCKAVGGGSGGVGTSPGGNHATAKSPTPSAGSAAATGRDDKGAAAAPSETTGAAAAEGGDGSAAAAAAAPSMQEALEQVLSDSAAGNTDRLESLFETSVLLFLRADYRGAISQVGH